MYMRAHNSARATTLLNFYAPALALALRKPNWQEAEEERTQRQCWRAFLLAQQVVDLDRRSLTPHCALRTPPVLSLCDGGGHSQCTVTATPSATSPERKSIGGAAGAATAPVAALASLAPAEHKLRLLRLGVSL